MSMSSGVTVSVVLLHAVCLRCSQSACSPIAACLVFLLAQLRGVEAVYGSGTQAGVKLSEAACIQA